MTASFGSIVATIVVAFGLMLSVGHVGQHSIFSGAAGVVIAGIVAILLTIAAERAWKNLKPPLER
jgi:membrane-associated phospholipid phosphatase